MLGLQVEQRLQKPFAGRRQVQGMRSAVGVRACGLAIASMLLVFLTTKAVLSQEDNNAIAFMLIVHQPKLTITMDNNGKQEL